jgi:hypothetical protein
MEYLERRYKTPPGILLPNLSPPHDPSAPMLATASPPAVDHSSESRVWIHHLENDDVSEKPGKRLVDLF